MSEYPLGEGWWIASDDRWYPPELHPDVTGEPWDGYQPEDGPMEDGPTEEGPGGEGGPAAGNVAERGWTAEGADAWGTPPTADLGATAPAVDLGATAPAVDLGAAIPSEDAPVETGWTDPDPGVFHLTPDVTLSPGMGADAGGGVGGDAGGGVGGGVGGGARGADAPSTPAGTPAGAASPLPARGAPGPAPAVNPSGPEDWPVTVIRASGGSSPASPGRGAPRQAPMAPATPGIQRIEPSVRVDGAMLAAATPPPIAAAYPANPANPAPLTSLATPSGLDEPRTQFSGGPVDAEGAPQAVAPPLAPAAVSAAPRLTPGGAAISGTDAGGDLPGGPPVDADEATLIASALLALQQSKAPKNENRMRSLLAAAVVIGVVLIVFAILAGVILSKTHKPSANPLPATPASAPSGPPVTIGQPTQASPSERLLSVVLPVPPGFSNAVGTAPDGSPLGPLTFGQSASSCNDVSTATLETFGWKGSYQVAYLDDLAYPGTVVIDCVSKVSSASLARTLASKVTSSVVTGGPAAEVHGVPGALAATSSTPTSSRTGLVLTRGPYVAVIIVTSNSQTPASSGAAVADRLALQQETRLSNG